MRSTWRAPTKGRGGSSLVWLRILVRIDRYLEASRKDFEAQREAARATDPMFYQKLANATLSF